MLIHFRPVCDTETALSSSTEETAALCPGLSCALIFAARNFRPPFVLCFSLSVTRPPPSSPLLRDRFTVRKCRVMVEAVQHKNKHCSAFSHASAGHCRIVKPTRVSPKGKVELILNCVFSFCLPPILQGNMVDMDSLKIIEDRRHCTTMP